MPELTYTNTLVATLGGQPQVVTFTLDLLLRHGVSIGEVIVIHPQAVQPRLRHALECLNAEFTGDRYQINGQTLKCHFRPKVLELDHIPLDDITDNTAAKGTRETIYSFFEELKQQPRHIHLSVTGGRRLMSLLAISAAQLKFDSFDHIWHIYTPEHIQMLVKEGKQMHVPVNAGVNLIEVPFFPLGDYFSALSQSHSNTRAVEQSGKAQMDSKERAHCAYVERKATHRQLDVLRCFAHGLSTQQTANKLSISIKTVYSHKTVLLDLCKEVWDIPENAPPDPLFFYKRFSRYFEENS